MRLPNGEYVTDKGSYMRISGEHSGISEVEWDWLEERACPDCVVDPYEDDGCLKWTCKVCGGGYAELRPLTQPPARG